MRIALIAWHILETWSGVERSLVELADAMLRRGHSVVVLAQTPRVANPPSPPLMPIPAGAGLIRLDVSTPQSAADARRAAALCGCDVALGRFPGRGYGLLPWLFAGSGTPLVATEANHPDALAHEGVPVRECHGALAAADAVQILLESYRGHYPESLRQRIECIGNPAPAAKEVDWQKRAARRTRLLLGLGRFDDWYKRFSLLLRAWALLAPDFPHWTLALVGDGPDRDAYQALMEKLDLTERVWMPGATPEVDAWYSRADIFCLPSRQEGFPMVLGEAAAWRLPLVGAASCEAARELIPPGAGALARDDTPAGLAGALRPLLAAEPEDRRAVGDAAGRAFARFAPEKVHAQWETFLARVAARRGDTRLDRILRCPGKALVLEQVALEIVARPLPDDGTASDQGRPPE